MSFSERLGFKPVRDTLQIDDIDKPLRNGLWNAFDDLSHRIYFEDLGMSGEHFNRLIWTEHLKRTRDSMPGAPRERKDTLKTLLLYDFEWYEVFDFVEFAAQLVPNFSEPFRKECNRIFEREKSGYRFVGLEISPITDEVEIEEIEAAMSAPGKLAGVRSHISDALVKLGDREEPDYRNSIKESISAVESLCKVIAGDDRATLGKALDTLTSRGVELHPSLREGFKKIYGYTSDAGGIRHAMLDESKVDFADAKFMLVACSAFVNYLIMKAGESGIALE